MIKIFNNRPIVFVAISLVSGILLGFCFVKIKALAIVLSIMLGLIIVSIFFLFAIKTKVSEIRLLAICKFITSHFKTLIGIVIFLVLGILLFFVSCISFDNTYEISGRHITSGYITSVRYTEDNKAIIVLDDVKIMENGNLKELKGKTYLRISIVNAHDNRIAVGNVMTAVSEISNRSILKNSEIFGYYYKHNIKYEANCSAGDIFEVDYNIKFLDEIRQDISKLLEENMNYSSEIAYALVMGDTTKILDSRIETFRESGIAHIFAVSGLHVGFLVAMLTFILSRFKMNRKVQLGVITAILIAYCTLCGFSPSMIRASIMSIVCLSARCFGKMYDGLVTISLSAILILLVKPLYIFEVGMQLSYFCILSLLLLTPRFKQVFSVLFKNTEGFKNKLLDALSMSLAINVGTLPIVISCFGKFAVLGILFNLIAIPIISVIFVLLIISILISVIIPPISAVLALSDWLLYAFEYPFFVISSSINLSLSLKSFGGFAVTYYGAMIISSDYLFIQQKKRIIICTLLMVVTLFGVALM